MIKNTRWAIWYLFTTMLSIFSISSIRIFDGFNWPFYLVTVNALISLCGLIFHIHVSDQTERSPVKTAARFLLLLNSLSVFIMIGFSLFIISTQYHNSLHTDGAFTSPDTLEDQLRETGAGA